VLRGRLRGGAVIGRSEFRKVTDLAVHGRLADCQSVKL